MPLSVWMPLVLWASPLILSPALAWGSGGVDLFIAGLVAHVIGADWLLIRRWPAGASALTLAVVQLAIGAPSAIFAAGMSLYIAHEGDVAWMGLPFVVAPALLIWPVVLVGLARGPARA